MNKEKKMTVRPLQLAISIPPVAPISRTSLGMLFVSFFPEVHMWVCCSTFPFLLLPSLLHGGQLLQDTSQRGELLWRSRPGFQPWPHPSLAA